MKTHSIYDLTTGVIRMSITSNDPRVLEINLGENEGAIEGEVSALNCLVIGGEIKPRPEIAQSATHKIKQGEELVVGGIPEGTTLHHPGGTCVIDDGELSWSSAEPGVFELMMINAHYKPCQIKIEVFNEDHA